jgi:hypothetical protein
VLEWQLQVLGRRCMRLGVLASVEGAPGQGPDRIRRAG